MGIKKNFTKQDATGCCRFDKKITS